MQGALLPVTVEWIILALAPVLALAACFRYFLRCRGIFGYRNGIAGPKSEVTRTGLGDDFTDRYDQLTGLGFQPEGVFWETMIGAPKARAYIFVDPRRNCFAAVYRLFGKDINVTLLTSFEDGAFVETYDTPGKEFDEPNRIINRLPSQPMARLLAAHEASETRMIAGGRTLWKVHNLDAIPRAHEIVFFHPATTKQLREYGRAALSGRLSLMASCAVPLSLVAACCFMWPVVHTMLLLGAAIWVISVSTLFLLTRTLVRLLSTGEKKAVSDCPEPEPYICRIRQRWYLLAPLIPLAAWQFGVERCALAALIIVSSIAAVDLVRIFVWSARSPFAAAKPDSEA
jgi:hypothetical protein